MELFTPCDAPIAGREETILLSCMMESNCWKGVLGIFKSA